MPENARDPEEIQATIREHREDLVASVAELEQIVRDKLDVRAQVNRSLDRLRDNADDLVERAEWQVRSQPQRALAVALGAGFLLGIGVMIYARRR